MKEFLKRNKWLILLISWMVVIFIFSNTPGDESSKQSGLVLNILMALGIDMESIFGDIATFIIRKGAHMTEYFILAFFSYKFLKENLNSKKCALKALMLTFLYACTDEFHQYFIPGRAAAFKDVLIDTSGAIIFIIINKGVETLRKVKHIENKN